MPRWRAVLTLCAVLSSGLAAAQDSRDDIKRWLASYDVAFASKDLARLSVFYHPDVTIYEGGGVNTGWADYRDHHLGPELEEMQSPTLSHSDVTVNMLDKDGQAAYVTSEYRLKTRLKDREVDVSGLETLVVSKQPGGGWKIRHSHTSSRRRPATPAPTAPGSGRD
jgi:ketosteroid isomerase-like protein